MSKVCPKCNKVYDDDVTVCPDCQVELTAQTEESGDAASAEPAQQEEKQISVFSLAEEESAQRVIEYMKEQGIEGEYRYNFRERTFKIFVSQSDARNALRACTTFYAIEAKRLKAEEDKKREEEEAARRAAEEEERRKREEEERIKREAEEAERKKREAEEAARKAAEQEAIRKAEEESKRKAEEAERVRREAEEAVRKAEEAARKIEEEAKRAAEEEARRKVAEEEARRKAAEEEARRKAAEEEAAKQEEERKRQEARENRRKMFEAGIREAEAQKQEERKKKFAYIPHVEGETVQEESSSAPVIEDVQPEAGPIYVETEPVDEYEVGDTIVVDAVEVEASDPDDDFYNTTEDIAEEETATDDSSSVFPDFMSNIKSSKNLGSSPLFGGSFDDDDDESEDDTETVTSPFSFSTQSKPQKPLVEDMFTDNVFSSTDKLGEDTVPVTTSPSFSEETREETKETIEEVINNQLKSSSVAPLTSSPKNDDIDDILDDGIYKGFVPDYHQEDEDVVDEDALVAQNYGFDPEEYKKLKAKTAKKAQERKSNPPKYNRNPNNKDFIVMEEPSLDDRKGFVPDYSSKDEDALDYYTKRTTIDYSKYRNSPDDAEKGTLASLNATLRSSSQTELSKLFENDVLRVASKPQDYVALKSATYIIAMTGGQLNSLFTSWLMTNCTAVTVKQFVKDGATPDENYKNKIEGIKNLIKQNFGKLDDAVLDIIVKKFYNKYLDE